MTLSDLKRMYWAANPELLFTRFDGSLVTIRGFRHISDEFDVIVDYVNEEKEACRDYLSSLKPHLKALNKLSEEDFIFIGSLINPYQSWGVQGRDEELFVLKSEDHKLWYWLDDNILVLELYTMDQFNETVTIDGTSWVKIIDFLRSRGYNLDFPTDEFVEL